MEKHTSGLRGNFSSIDQGEGGSPLEELKSMTGVRETIKKRPKAVLWCVWAILIMVASSYTNGAGNAALEIPEFRKDFGRQYKGNFILPARWQSAMYGAGGGAAFFGAIGTGWLADKVGRKRTFVIAFDVKFVSITLQVVSTSIQVFTVGMLFGGFGWGAFCTLCTIYISEIAPLRSRGILTAAAPIAMTLGSLATAVVVNETGQEGSRWAYRTTFVVGYAFAGSALLLLPFAPESPWWLVNAKKDSLQALHMLSYVGTPGANKGTVALSLAYCYFFNVTIGATAYSIAAEAPTARLRIKTASMAFALENGLFTMWEVVLPYLFNPDKANLGAKVAFILGGLSVLCTVYVWVYQPEFAGRSYEELNELFQRRIPARKFKSSRLEVGKEGAWERD